jgi:hypothetical protein
MSQETQTPDETESTANPVGTQEVSSGEVKPTELAKQSQDAHNAAHNGGSGSQDIAEHVKKAINSQFAVTEGWQPREVVKFVINCPSGQTALVKHLEAKDLLRAGLLEEMDRFTKQLFPAALDEQGAPVEKTEDDASQGIWAILNDPDRRVKFYDITNRLMVVASVAPKIVNDGVALRDNEDGEPEEVFGYEVESIDEQVALFEKPVPPLKDGEAYAGAIDFADRMAFFQELNKPLGLIEPFREGSNAMLASLEPSQGSELQTERPL